MSKRRSRELIILNILNICMDGATKTKIVYQANMNFLTAHEYLNNLIKKGLIEAIPEDAHVVYKITIKGLELRRKFEVFQGVMKELCAIN